jgi:NADPH:quinone reductase-like Zn-dependent oxidoreductase
MRALQIQAPGRAEVVDIAMPQPGPGEVRVRVSLVNTCPQWDLHLDAGEPMFVGQQIPYPYTSGQPGHEMVGVVDAIGEGVTAFRVGQRVAAWRDAGHHRQGCYAEYRQPPGGKHPARARPCRGSRHRLAGTGDVRGRLGLASQALGGDRG